MKKTILFVIGLTACVQAVAQSPAAGTGLYCVAYCKPGDVIIIRSAIKVAEECDFSKQIVKVSDSEFVCVKVNNRAKRQ